MILKEQLIEALNHTYTAIGSYASNYVGAHVVNDYKTFNQIYGGGNQQQNIYAVYGINFGSGGGSSSSGEPYSRTELFKSATPQSGVISLSDAIDNYDDIEIDMGWAATSDTASHTERFNAEYFITNFPYVANPTNANPHALLEMWASNGFSCAVGNATNTALQTWGHNGSSGILAVYGINFGSGGSSGSSGSELSYLTQVEYDELPSSKESDNVAYFIHDNSSEYTYHVDNTGTIVIRVYHEGESDEEAECFFCGWNQTAGDVPIPSEISEYLPADTVNHIYHSNSYSASNEMNGYIGFYNGNIRMWNIPRSATISGIVYGVVKISDPNISEPQSNLYSDPYVDANTCKIVMNGLVFSSNDQSFEKTLIYEGTDTIGSLQSHITLEDSWDNYDVLEVVAFYAGSSTYSDYVSPEALTKAQLMGNDRACALATYGTSSCACYHLDANHKDMDIFGTNSNNIWKIYGIKFGSGSSSPQEEYSTTEKVIGKWIDGRDVYQITIGDETTPISQQDLSSLNIDFTIDIDGIFGDSNLGLSECTYTTTASSTTIITTGYVTYTKSTHMLNVVNPNGYVYCVTLKYVKSTD